MQLLLTSKALCALLTLPLFLTSCESAGYGGPRTPARNFAAPAPAPAQSATGAQSRPAPSAIPATAQNSNG